MTCPYFDEGRCRSCSRLDTPYPDQIAEKEARLGALLADFSPAERLSAVESPPLGFRNKAKMAALGAAHAPQLGIVDAEGEEIDLCGCPLYPDDMRGLLEGIRGWIRSAGLPPYKIDRRKIQLDQPLKVLGEYDVPVKLHREVTTPVKVKVEAEAQPEESAAE